MTRWNDYCADYQSRGSQRLLNTFQDKIRGKHLEEIQLQGEPKDALSVIVFRICTLWSSKAYMCY